MTYPAPRFVHRWPNSRSPGTLYEGHFRLVLPEAARGPVLALRASAELDLSSGIRSALVQAACTAFGIVMVVFAGAVPGLLPIVVGTWFTLVISNHAVRCRDIVESCDRMLGLPRE